MGIKEIRQLLINLNRVKNITILISSHILGELSQLATCYGFINDGKLVEEISAEKLAEKCKHCLAIKVDNAEKAAIILEEKLNCNKYEVLNNNLINVYEYLEEPFIVNKELLNGGVMVSSLDKVGSSLEDYFINLIGAKKMVKLIKADIYRYLRSPFMYSVCGALVVGITLVMLSAKGTLNINIVELRGITRVEMINLICDFNAFTFFFYLMMIFGVVLVEEYGIEV